MCRSQVGVAFRFWHLQKVFDHKSLLQALSTSISTINKTDTSHFHISGNKKCPGCSAGPRLNCELFTSFNNVPLILRRSIALIKTLCSALRPNTAVTLESVKTLRVHWVYLPARPVWVERSVCCRSSSVNRRWMWYGAGMGATAPLGHYIKKHDAASTLTPGPAWPGALCHQDE